jgi:hypothetical protein
VKLPGKSHVAGFAGARELIQESGQHGTGHQLLKKLIINAIKFYHTLFLCTSKSIS